MVLITAQRIIASEGRGRVRSHGPVGGARASQAKVRSTAHRRGITANPRCPAGLRTTWIVVPRMRAAQSGSRPAERGNAGHEPNRTDQIGLQQHEPGAVSVLHRRRADHDGDQQAEGVGHAEPGSAIDLRQ
jgi:hypothetical protein